MRNWNPRLPSCGVRAAKRIWPVFLLCLLAPAANAQGTPSQTPAAPVVGAPHKSQRQFLLTVKDENGLAVSSARVIVEDPLVHIRLALETDYAGRVAFTGFAPANYVLRIEKPDFYPATLADVHLAQAGKQDVVLHHQQEFTEVVNVYAVPEAIDLQQLPKTESLTSEQIQDIPYPTTRDVSNLLPFIPGVVRDYSNQIHFDGAAANQTLVLFDGFNITQPVTGLLDMRSSPDALRSIDVQSTRYSSEFGKGSGGVLSFESRTGDDRFRVSANDFLPTVQNVHGLSINNWTPRVNFSGPLVKHRAWFFLGTEGEYDRNIVKELPRGSDTNAVEITRDLGRVQVHPAPGNVLTIVSLINISDSEHAGISPLNPTSTTTRQDQSAYLVSMKDQAYMASGALLEAGAGVTRYRANEDPLGNLPFVERPEGLTGNFYRTSRSIAQRVQGYSNAFLPPFTAHGRHLIKIGVDMDAITDHQSVVRRPISIVREDGTLARLISFPGSSPFERNNFEGTGYAQDHWSVSERWVVEPGVRFDWDQVVRNVLPAPRVATSYLLKAAGDTKLTAGIGLFYDETNLSLITRPLGGTRLEQDYAADGITPVGLPIVTSFHPSVGSLQAPRFVNWSVSIERRLPGNISAKLDFMERRGHHVLTYINQLPPPEINNVLTLTNSRRDRYDAAQLTLQRVFRNGHTVFGAYTRSRARSNAVLDFDLDNPIFAQQAGGPVPWDAPNRFVSHGWLPFFWRSDLGYSVDWRTGFPFSVVNQLQQLVGAPDSRRFPAFFTLNAQAEHRFRWHHYQFAVRVGMDNLTGRKNPITVNNNIDSPQFLTFSNFRKRSFNGRIRFLGRK
jgi:hypothetical protein